MTEHTDLAALPAVQRRRWPRTQCGGRSETAPTAPAEAKPRQPRRTAPELTTGMVRPALSRRVRVHFFGAAASSVRIDATGVIP